ncbi:hypothetical protein LshimejAT787_0112090 [Lyophyllum shimeji]|uniref:Uncharacterized protein n=1 Tax=Lyophyllum shimeji TaxID=47721 RepID=A0A9P3PE38_LYOSH|nr:hypothetical protein LshimejAT787_0112090 [Lyophyllum shimeji]
MRPLFGGTCFTNNAASGWEIRAKTWSSSVFEQDKPQLWKTLSYEDFDVGHSKLIEAASSSRGKYARSTPSTGIQWHNSFESDGGRIPRNILGVATLTSTEITYAADD